MNIKTAVLGFSFLALAACGDDEEYAFASGIYTVSNASSSDDECGLVDVYNDSTRPYSYGIDVAETATDEDAEEEDAAGAVFTFNPGNFPGATAASKPSATRTGNDLSVLTAASYTQNVTGTTCVLQVNRDVTGNVTGANAASLTLNFTASVASGDCSDEEALPVLKLPCQSTVNFDVAE